MAQFFGLIVKAETQTPLPKNEELDYKVTNAALQGTKQGERVNLYVHYAGEKFLICVLSTQIPNANIDLIFSAANPYDISFSITGSKTAEIHLSGFANPEDDDFLGMDGDGDYSDDEDEVDFVDDDASDMDDEDQSSDNADPKIGIVEVKEEEKKIASGGAGGKKAGKGAAAAKTSPGDIDTAGSPGGKSKNV